MGEKVRENRLRRWAKRLGVRIQKSRAKLFSVDDHGGYRLIDVGSNGVIDGSRVEMDIDGVEAALESMEDEMQREARG